jgi:hypothetical protein
MVSMKKRAEKRSVKPCRVLRWGGVLLLLAFVTPVLEARTLIWYSFNEGAVGETTTLPGEKTIVNAAETGDVYNGRVWTCTAKGGTGWYGYTATSDYVGTYAPAFPDGVRVIDPQSGVSFTNNRSLYLDCEKSDGYGKSPLITVDADTSLNVSNFTVECFVKFDAPVSGTWRTIAMRARDQVNGADVWAIRVSNDGRLNVRTSYHENNVYREVAGLEAGNVLDGKWHHVALVVNSDAKKMLLYQDYNLVGSETFGNDWVPYAGTDPIVLGNTPHANYGTLGDAWIDEFRFSDDVLTPNQFLRFSMRPPSYVDEDTVVYLTFDYYSWFGNDTDVLTSSSSYALYNEAYGPAATNAYLYCQIGGARYGEESVPGKGNVRNPFWSTEAINQGAVHFKTNAAPMKSGALLISDVNRRITSGSFTIEGFFQWRAYPTASHYFMMEHSTNGQAIGFTMSDNRAKKTIGMVKMHVKAGPEAKDYASEFTKDLVDARWHHLAMTYDQDTETVRFYCDYNCIGAYSNIGELRVLPVSGSNGGNTYENNLMIGTAYGMWHAYQMNDGLIDEVRITARALEPGEFLLRGGQPDASSPTLTWLSFEEDSLVPEPAGEWRTWTSTKSNGHSFTAGALSENGARVLVCDGRGTILREANQRSLSMPLGWYVRYMKDPMIEGIDTPAFTIEFFAKGTDSWKYGSMVEVRGRRQDVVLNPETVANNNDVDVDKTYSSRCVCAIQTAFTNIYFRTQAGTEKSHNNAMTGDSGDLEIVKDGKWHHIAATFETVNQNYTSVKFYYDYRLVAENSRFWGALRRKLIDTEVRVGGAIKGEIDEVRISRGALAVEDFLRLRCQGFQIILR